MPFKVTAAENTLAKLIRSAFPFEDCPSSLPAIEPSDWPQLVKTAEYHGVAPLCYASIRKWGAVDVAPATERKNLRRSYLWTSVGSHRAFEELGMLAERLDREGIPFIVLKGGALAGSLYPDPGLRPLGDLDLLIPRESLSLVKKLLKAEGCEPALEPSPGFVENFSMEQAFYRSGIRPLQVDIHWHVLKAALYTERVPTDWFWEHTTEIQVGDRTARVFSPTAQLVHLTTHYAFHDFKRLIWSYDIALLLDQCGAQIRWDELFEAVDEFGLAQPVREAFADVREIWDVEVPEVEVSRLAELRSSLIERTVFAAATAPFAGGLVLLNCFALKGFGRKVNYLLRTIFPTFEYLRSRLQSDSKLRIAFFYVWRIARGVYRAGRSVLAIVFQTAQSISVRGVTQ